MVLHCKSKAVCFRAHCQRVASIKGTGSKNKKMAGKRRNALSSCPPYYDARKPYAIWQNTRFAHRKEARLNGADASRRPQ